MEFSAVLLNWKRQHNLPAILDSLSAVSRIREIIVWDNACTFESDRARVVNCGRNICTFGRFRAVDLATCDAIYTQDDDIVVNDVDQILDAYELNPNNIVASLTQGHMLVEAYRKPWVQLGWGSAFSKQSAEVLKVWLDQHGEDLLLHRKADRIFTILHGQHLCRNADVTPLLDPDGKPSQSSRDALYRQQDHNVLTDRAKELALALRESNLSSTR